MFKNISNTYLSKVKVKSLSRVRLFATTWTVAYQAVPSTGISRQEYWSGLPFPSPGDLPHPGIEAGSPALWADALPSEPPGKISLLEQSRAFEQSGWSIWGFNSLGHLCSILCHSFLNFLITP